MREPTAPGFTNKSCHESGQILVIFALLIVVISMFVMAVVDVGFFLHERALAQQTADAAALAGAQELPDNPTSAEAVARDYVGRNGLDPNTVDISFRCTSQSEFICNEAAGVYDTIVVTPHSKAPAFFGGLLSIVGAGGICWVQGCDVEATAAGCRGSCGPIGNAPVDVAVILDHSLSMTATDLINAQNAILEMETDFNHTLQKVAIAVTPPVFPTNYCDSINSWNDPQNWLPAPLTDTFQSSPHVLDHNDPAVEAVECVERGGPPGYHTNIGNPLAAATAELAANGRPDVTWGIILVTDGAANVAPPTTFTASTGERFCTSQAPVTSSSGDNNGYETSAGNACANGGGNASDNDSGNSSSTSCGSTGKDRHTFANFGADAGIPGDATVAGIEVRADAWAAGSGTRRICLELSWNGGASWTSAKTVDIGGTESIRRLGSSSDTWGRGWSLAELSNTNLRVRLTSVGSSTTTDFRLDAVAVNIHYTYPNLGVNHLGPCDWAMQQADAAKALGIEVYTIAFGASDSCNRDSLISPWYGVSAVDFLKALATDDQHFYNEPKTEDLDPVFQAIGSQLTAGSRLVE